VAVALARPVVVSTGRARTVAEAQALLATAAATVETQHARYGALAEVHRAMQGCLAWDTIYEPQQGRVLSTVSRLWNVNTFGGYVIFDWDTYFAGWMAALDKPDLAVANLIEITRAITADGFVPTFEAADGNICRDRSQPPVGALAVRQVHRLVGERCLLEETFPNLLRWNRWWPERRQQDGLLCWGAEVPATDPRKVKKAMLESGLDNSPMYDLADFSDRYRQLLLADVGLTSLYILDCEELAAIAGELGETAVQSELQARATLFRANLQRCWDGQRGIFANLHTNTGTLSDRWSPTSFYPLLAAAAEPAQAERLVREHLLNPAEFWGTWVIPSIARSDPAFPEQEYWRGRIWAPMNFLVYLGLCRTPGFAAERRELADRSRDLLLREWRLHGHVHENYNANTGMGCDVASSDPFYHWGGLLGLIALMEDGIAPPALTQNR
jgi:hypothetical protein